MGPLLLAVQNGHFELAIALVDAGADPNDVRTGFTPLHMIPGCEGRTRATTATRAAIGSGRLSSLEFVREIVKRGANVNLRLPKGAPKSPTRPRRSSLRGRRQFSLPPTAPTFR